MINSHWELPFHTGCSLAFWDSGNITDTEYVDVPHMAQRPFINLHPAFGRPVAILPRQRAIAHSIRRLHGRNNVDEIVRLFSRTVRSSEGGYASIQINRLQHTAVICRDATAIKQHT